jgi:hypothetical protein
MKIRTRLTACLGTVAAALFASSAAAASEDHLFYFTWTQSFETGVEGMSTFRGGSIAQATSGFNGVASRSGDHHAVGTLISNNPGGSVGSGFRRAGGLFDETMPNWFLAEYFKESVAFYIDHSAGQVGDRWFATMSDSSQRGFWFQRGHSGWQVATNFVPGGIEAIYASAVDINASGWLTFERTVSLNEGTGLSDMQYAIYDINDNLLYQQSSVDVAGFPANPLTWAVGWRGGGDTTVLVDAISFELGGGLIPTPGAVTLAVFGFGLAFVRRRR